jgi:D-sedoheptulose 7-phosphate isomerase
LAAELVGRFRRERQGLAAIALTTDTSILTAIANDYGYNAVFARQVEAIGGDRDLLVGISTSGNSANVVAAIEMGRSLVMTNVVFTGEGGGKLSQLAHYALSVKARDTARVQEAHILVGHMLCDRIEVEWMDRQRRVITIGADDAR